MLLDNTLTFADNKALTKGAGSVTKSDAIQVSHFARDLGVGSDVPLTIKINEAIAMAEAGTITASIIFADDKAMSANAVTVAAAPVKLEGGVGLPSGYTFSLNKLPYHSDKKWMQVTITVEKAITTGSFTAAIADSVSLV